MQVTSQVAQGAQHIAEFGKKNPLTTAAIAGGTVATAAYIGGVDFSALLPQDGLSSLFSRGAEVLTSKPDTTNSRLLRNICALVFTVGTLVSGDQAIRTNKGCMSATLFSAFSTALGVTFLTGSGETQSSAITG